MLLRNMKVAPGYLAALKLPAITGDTLHLHLCAICRLLQILLLVVADVVMLLSSAHSKVNDHLVVSPSNILIPQNGNKSGIHLLFHCLSNI